jgi:hypothetical protein
MSKAQGIAQSANQGQFKNRIINGAMTIDQRNNGASVSRDGSTYTYQVDRFYSGGLNGSGVFSVQRISDAPAGFSNSTRITVTTADSSLGSSEEYGFQQTIEGHNVFDLNWGTANAQSVTLSFWVKSSLTGTFGVAIRNAGTWNRSYVGQYTITAANTWEYKTISITGETTGSWGTGTSASINVAFDLGAGSGFNGTANTWNTSGATRVSGNVSVISNNSATWQVTGVQLEKGSTATSFDYRPYGTELALCQRYCPVFNIKDGDVYRGQGVSTTLTDITLPYIVTPRVPATGITTSAANTFAISNGAAGGNATAIAFGSSGVSTLSVRVTTTAGSPTIAATNCLAFYAATNAAQIIATGCEL